VVFVRCDAVFIWHGDFMPETGFRFGLRAPLGPR
jgi:hypothetical protein